MSSGQALQSHAKLIIPDYALPITCVASDIAPAS